MCQFKLFLTKSKPFPVLNCVCYITNNFRLEIIVAMAMGTGLGAELRYPVRNYLLID